jgi:hypothetical protein
MSLNQQQLAFLQDFERGLNPERPDRSRVPADILGYGEISTVFAIHVKGLEGLAFKRLPLFHNQAEIEAYQTAYEKYNRILQEEIGLHLPGYSHASLSNPAGRPIFYIIQRQLPSASIGNQAIRLLSTDMTLALVRRVLSVLHRVWAFNRRQDQLQIALDGQISNWSIDGFDAQNPHVDDATKLTYLDTSTPLFRVEGVEQLNTELFLRSAPSFLAWILRLLFLEDVVDRYYDLRRVAIDLVANFYKEQRPDLIPPILHLVNDFFTGEAAELGISPVQEQEVRSYYREDALIWTLYLSFRRFDRFLQTRLLGREYPYILPGKIKR